MLKPEFKPSTKTLSPQEYEQKLLELESAPQKNDPLDAPAATVKYYIPRLKQNTAALSKKQILQAAIDLAGSDYNEQSDVNKLVTMSKDLGLKAIQRIFTAVIINPLDNVEVSITVEKEKRLFILFDSLLTNKYMNCLAKGLSESGENKRQEFEEFVLHKIKTSDILWKKRSKLEQDTFLIGNKMLCSKFLMILVKTAEHMKEEKNG